MKNCTSCELHNHRSTVVVGDVTKAGSLCFIGEAPGLNEDRQGRPFVGRSGKLLDKMLAGIGLHRSEVNVLNIVKCRPPNNRTPTNQEMAHCGDKWLVKQLEFLKPSMIVTLGSVALRYFYPHAKMTRLKGVPQYHHKLGITIFPLFHPSFILRNGNRLIDEYAHDFELLSKLLRTRTTRKFDTQTTIHRSENKQKSLDDYF